MSTGKFFRSFKHAIRGIGVGFKEEFNAKVHFLASLAVLLLGVIFKVAWFEWMILILVIGGVFSMELINTSIEALADLYSTKYNPKIKKIKDLSAGAVLVASIAALIVGMFIFIPKILVNLEF